MARYEPLDWYDAPLYYDIIFDTGTRSEADFLEDVLAQHGESEGWDVLEPACGSGRLVAELARRGYDVTGCDINVHMLRYARRRLQRRSLNAELLHQPMQSFVRPRSFDLAHCLVSTFKYLLSHDDAAAHLKSVARSLRPGGIYVLGLHLTDYDDDRPDTERWTGSRGGVHVTCNIRAWPADRRRRIEELRSRLTVRRSDAVRHYETNWRFRTYNLGELRALLRAVPQLEHVATYDFEHDITKPRELDGRRLDVVLVLRRRG